MKSLLSLIASSFLCLTINAATWTFHVPTNLPCSLSFAANTGNDPLNGDGEWDKLSYDKPWLLDDTHGAIQGDLGWYSLHIFSGWISFGWTPSGNSITTEYDYAFVWLDSGDPDYLGGGYSTSSTAGEYWVDFISDGTVRTSTSQPTEFGKYLWDGSVNPNFVEPFAKSKVRKNRK